MSRVVVAGVAALAAAAYIFIYTTERAGLPIRADGFSYYLYLPAWFIHHDTSLATTARDCCGGEFPAYTFMTRWPGTRRWVNPHPIGVAIMQAPLFVFAHGLTKWTNLSSDGFTLYYQHAVGISGLLWTVAGLYVLRRLLLRHFSESVTAVTLVAITFGTNLFHYATYDSGYSHAYSFFLIAAFLDLTERWHREPDRRTSLLLGLTSGLIVLTRHTNGLFILVFALYGVTSAATLRRSVERLWTERRRILEMIAIGTVIIAPQVAIYVAATGQPLLTSHRGLGFDFSSPQVGGVLFSVRKGVFFWSPVLLLSVAGLIRLAAIRHPARAFVLPSAIFLAAHTFIIASWWDWQFGGSYGHRGFVDVMPVFALGLASAFAWSAERRATRPMIATVAAVAIALSVFQMLQYWNGVIPISDTTWDDYRAVFLRWR